MSNFIKSIKITIALVYLVIIAGALVRMTGSGMGCPDWPKCFGYLIPPTELSELTWAPNHTYFEGQVIIKNDTLWIAKQDFTSGKKFNKQVFTQYTKHDYAVFNAAHTWIEYINRLIGALAGLATLIMTILSLRYRKTNPALTWLSSGILILLLFQAWLGATVVFSVLNPVKITVHMLVALLIVALLLFLLNKAQPKKIAAPYNRFFTATLSVSLVFSLIQIALGTQVRQYVDEHTTSLGYGNLATIFNMPELNFYLHRSFAWAVLLVNALLLYLNNRHRLGLSMSWLLALILTEIAAGIAMVYFNFPFGSQALHLIVAAALFGLQFNMYLRSSRSLK